MQVTSVSLSFPYKVGQKFKCWAKIVLDEVLFITGIRLFENKQNDGSVERYIRFPDKQPSLHSTGGEFVSIAVVNTNDEELRKHIITAVFEEYDKHPKNPANWKKKENNVQP